MGYKVEFRKTASKQLLNLPAKVVAKVKIITKKLSENPYDENLNIKALKGLDAYRIRLGDYRIIYTIKNDVLIVEIIEIFHRQKGY
jgi:mRNA interferase RelE/StbE